MNKHIRAECLCLAPGMKCHGCVVNEYIWELEDALNAGYELARSWICTAQKPTVREEIMDKCGMQLLEILGEEEIT